MREEGVWSLNTTLSGWVPLRVSNTALGAAKLHDTCLQPGDALPEVTSATAASQEADHRIDVLVSWKRGRKFDLASQLEEVFENAEDRGKQIPPENQIPDKNLAGFPSGESFRDYLK
ncbi:Helicase C-terminal [Penicillium viridicatum]|nr:Helicase C-terminal [Penicillium viridicatum]